MRILVLCYEFPPLGGGGAKVVAGLSRQLVSNGHEVDIVTTGWQDLAANERVDGANVHRVASRRARVDRSDPPELASYLFAVYPLVQKLLKRHAYDVCNCHFIFPDGVLGKSIKKKGVPVLITAHGSDVPGYNPDRFQLLHRLLFPLWRRVVRHADGIVCPSPTLERLIKSWLPQARTLVIPNGFDPNRFKPAGGREKRILVVSRLVKRKGVQHIINAFGDLDTDFELHIVGDGPYLQDLQAAAQRIDKAVCFRGWLDNADPELKNLYETSAIFALPSEAENFPVCLLEAMASGMAVITSSGTGCADVVGDAGLLVPPNGAVELRDALQRLIDDTDLRERLAVAARKRVEENFTWPQVAGQYENAFRQCISARSKQ